MSFITSGISVHAFSSNDLNIDGEIEITENNKTRAAQQIYQDKMYGVKIEAGYYANVTFIVPTSGYYSAETLVEDVDSIIEVQSRQGKFTDDDSGVGKASALGFYAQSGETININIKGYGSTNGSQVFLLRRQKFTTFTFDGSNEYGVNTTNDRLIPDQYMSYYYDTKHVFNPVMDDFVSLDESGVMIRSWSDVILFSGHGYYGNPVFMNGAAGAHALTNSSFKVLQGTKFIFWSICSGASFDNVVHDSILAGAKTSMGFAKTVTVGSSKNFTNQLFTEIGKNGRSVVDAAVIAANSFWHEDAVQDYRIEGDYKLVINNAKVQSRSIPDNQQVSEEDFYEALSNGTYEKQALAGNGFRYYKMISGFKSNDYYDVFYDDNNEIEFINKSGNSIDKNDDLPNVNNTRMSSTNKVLQNALLKENISKHEVNHVVAKDEDKVRFIEIDYITYKNEDYETLDQIYTDVETGENISFDDFYNMK